MTWSCAFALDPHIRFFLGSMFSFQGSVSGFDKLLSSASTHHFTRSIYYKYYLTRSAWVSLNLSNFSLPVPSDFGFCFVAVSRRLVYNTTWPRLCQHFFRHFLRFFRETLGFVEKETCLIIAFIGLKISSKNLKKSSIFSCFFHKNCRKSVKFFFVPQIFFLKSCRFFLLSSLSADCRFNTYPSRACFYILSFKINTLSFQ